MLLRVLRSGHVLLRGLRYRQRLLRILESMRNRLRTLWLHIQRLPLSLLTIQTPLRDELLRKLLLVHSSFTLVSAKDDVESEQHQEVVGGKFYKRAVLWLSLVTRSLRVDWKLYT